MGWLINNGVGLISSILKGVGNLAPSVEKNPKKSVFGTLAAMAGAIGYAFPPDLAGWFDLGQKAVSCVMETPGVGT